MHDVIGRDPVGGDDQQLVAEIVDLANLAGGEQGEISEGGSHKRDASGWLRQLRRRRARRRTAAETGTNRGRGTDSRAVGATRGQTADRGHEDLVTTAIATKDGATL